MKKQANLTGIDWQLVKLGWLPTVIVLSGLVFYVILGQRMMKKAGEYRIDTRETETKLAAIKAKVDYLESVDQAEIERLMALLNGAVFPDNKAYYLLDTVRSVAANYGYQVDSFSLTPGELVKGGEKVAGNQAVPLMVKVGLVGPRVKYEDYLAALEKGLPVMSIEGLKAKSSGDLTSLEMEVNAYFVPEGALKRVESISLAELKLSSEEMGLLTLLEGFKMVLPEMGGGGQSQGQFVRYERSDPFKPLFSLPE